MEEKNRKIRSGQAINTFSIGQIIPFPDNENLMLGSMNLWDKLFKNRINEAPFGEIQEEDYKIIDAVRLQRLLSVKYFKKPFSYNTNLIRLPGVRFPGWHYCAKCGTMRLVEIGHQGNELICRESRCANLKEGQNRLIPVRFVAVCTHGHIQDVPFDEWVHGKKTGHKLQWKSGYGSGDLGSISITCLDPSCGDSRSLAGMMQVTLEPDNERNITSSALSRIGAEENTDASEQNPNGIYCGGLKPWLGEKGMVGDPCNAHLRVLISGGSNVHYAKNMSSIYIPDLALKLGDYVNSKLGEKDRNKIEIILAQDIDESVKDDINNKFIEDVFNLSETNFSLEDIRKEIYQQIIGESHENVNFNIQEVDIRFEEYRYFLSKNDEIDGDLVYETKDLNIYDCENDFMTKHFDSIVLIKRLKETRAFYGFSRISPFDGKSIEESKEMLVSSGEEVDWLPAIQVFGEGIFIKFNDKKLEKWISSHPPTKKLEHSYHQAQERRNASYGTEGNPTKDINPVFILLHTFAHLLIKRLCFNCGYGSSALREKIYFSSHEETKMNGILIYTSSGDSEGSLGGLVRQGTEEHLYRNIKDALTDAEWCSADPVCSDIGQEGQGPDNINGAACHNCCILPETSCEEFNGLLDRSVVVGSIFNKEIGYFENN